MVVHIPSRSHCPHSSSRLKRRAWQEGFALAFLLLMGAATRGSLQARGEGMGEDEEEERKCTAEQPVVGLVADLSMLQHQLRGRIRIIDDCSFEVTEFDMLPGNDVFWWGAGSESLRDMLDGFPVSPVQLHGIFNGQKMTVKLVNTSWEDMQVLSVWSRDTASDYGHVILREFPRPTSPADAPSVAPSLAPAPSPLAPSPGEPIPPSPPPFNNHNHSPPPPAPPPLPPPKLGKPQPTMLDSCVQLSHRFRVRWTLDARRGFVDIALEAAVDASQYLAFGWADPEAQSRLMSRADVAVVGFNELEEPFVEDYFITDYVECAFDKKQPDGVCPDSVFGGNLTFDNLQLIHGQRIDGITFIRYRKRLASPDTRFDHRINASAEMNVIWSLGQLRQATPKASRLIPTYHGVPQGSAFGVTALRLDERIDDCQSVLEPAVVDAGLVVVADRGASISVTSGVSLHYPNPPGAAKSLFVNGHEAPVLKVERGVTVQFSVQAGHDLPLFITSDPVGGRFNDSAAIYAGGEDSHGVPAVPYLLTWTPNSTTPDTVYYQAYTEPKMGWKIMVVDGGLSDMYHNSVLLADGMVTLFWTLTATDISFAVRGEHPSGYLAIAFGSGMVNSWAYVGWIEDGEPKVGSYWIDGRDASNVHQRAENLSLAKCTEIDEVITFEFSRPLKPASCSDKCHVVDPLLPIKVVWAYGPAWTSGPLTYMNMHSTWSSTATVINLQTGVGEVEHLQPVFAVHGFMMFLAWGILMPFGVLAARYLKQQDWFLIHLYTQYSGLSVMVLGLLFAVGELQGFDFSSTHAKIGIVTFVLGAWQPLNAYFRPPKPAAGDRVRWPRRLWQWTHMFSGRAALAVAVAALMTGIVTLQDKGAEEDYVLGFLWAMVGWFAAIGALVWFIEHRRGLDRSQHVLLGSMPQSDWNGHSEQITLGDGDESEDDTRNLLQPSRENSGTSVPTVLEVVDSKPRNSPALKSKTSNSGDGIELESMRP